jgi:RNA polymerase sigma-70 factor (ECF subfamily)
MDGPDEIQALVDAARRGDPDAQGALFDRYYPAILRYARARLREPADADDAAAEAFVSALTALPWFTWRRVPFEAWLFRIAASKVADVHRRRARRPEAPLAAAPEASVASIPDPAGAVAAADERARLVAAVDRLPAAQRDVVILRFFLGRSVRETADQLGRTEGAVRQLQMRALERLRREVPA